VTAWSILIRSIHDFSRVCFPTQANSNLLTDLSRLDRLFTDFIRRARIVFNNSWPTPGKVPPPAPASIEKSSEAILAIWHDFIARFLSVVGSSVGALYVYIRDRLSYVAQLLQGLWNAYDRPHPMMAFQPIRRAQTILEALKLETTELARDSVAGESEGCDHAALQARAITLSEKVHALFPDVFPNNSVSLGSVVAIKRELLLACDNVTTAYEGILAYDVKLQMVTDAILGVGEALQQLLRELRVTRLVWKPLIVAVRKVGESGQTGRTADSVGRVRENIVRIQQPEAA
jgi:hypothetical protein